MTIEIIAILIFIIGYAAITLEHRLNLHKATIAVALGAFLWFLIGFNEDEAVGHAMKDIGADIFGLVVFLLAAMMLVEILVHYGLFDFIRVKLLGFGFSDATQLWVIAGIGFSLSPIVDNLTATIVMTQIARRFFKGENLLIAAAAIVISANAGGAFSPIGDVTTIMLWLGGKFSASDVIVQGFLPSLSILLISTFLLARRVKADTQDVEEERVVLTRGERFIIGTALASFSLPLIVSQMGLEPYVGLLMGLGVVGVLTRFFRVVEARKTHLDANIEKFLRGVDFAILLFFVGILLAVGALEHVGTLEKISASIFGEDPEFWRLVAGNAILGILSAIVDNIPLTAAAMHILKTTDPGIWVLLALTVGTGGSLLAIGSAAGVVAMGMVKELTFFRYMRIATLPALAGYGAAIGIWYIEQQLFFR